MPTDTIRPTAHAIPTGTVNDPANAYDANIGTNARILQATDNTASQLNVTTFAADTSPATRSAVVLHVVAGWGSADTEDEARVFFRKVSTDPWTQVWADNVPDSWGSLPSGTVERSSDITSLVGTQAAADWQVGLQFWNGTAGGGGPPDLET